jgi:transaldolase / glucose-6-phosphate isomerase
VDAPWLRRDLGDLEERVAERVRRLGEEEVVRRIWARDHTVWRDDPAEIADRLGWLDAPARAREEVEDLRRFAEEVAADGLTHAVLLGMGGSSLAPEVFRRVFGVAESMLDLGVLDTTHPNAVAALDSEVPLDRALFVVSSKSGTTVETRSHMAYFLERAGDGSRFVAITDPGTLLEAAAREAGFRRVFPASPDVGGRYSALTAFGLLPAALIGADLEAVLDSAQEAASACGPDVPVGRNPAAVLGAAMGEGALAGRDKLTLGVFHRPDAPGGQYHLEPLGAWTEQLVAESTGKDGTGIVPVDGERFGPEEAYGHDRLFVTLEEPPTVGPWMALDVGSPERLGRAFFVWELAAAVAGHVLGIHPFDQPDVQAAKDRTAELLDRGGLEREPAGDLDALLEAVRPGDYVAIQAFVSPTDRAWGVLEEARMRIRDHLRVATTLGFGPRYLHSTGQLHKGGPNTGVFVQVVDEPERDLPIPGRDFSFGTLLAAQAAGDLAALRDRGRRVARVRLEDLASWGG